MRKWHVGCVPVIDQGKLTGILTEVDLLLKIGIPEANLTQVKISELMTPNPAVLEEDATICSALHLMSVGGYRHLPVIRDGNAVGILSIRDVLRYLHENLLTPKAS